MKRKEMMMGVERFVFLLFFVFDIMISRGLFFWLSLNDVLSLLFCFCRRMMTSRK